MFIAMNRFRVAPGKERDFENIWKSRQSYLKDVPEFQEFHLPRGPRDEHRTLYASHTVWNSREAFEAWTNSNMFKVAHNQVRAPKRVDLGPLELEAFEVIL